MLQQKDKKFHKFLLLENNQKLLITYQLAKSSINRYLKDKNLSSLSLIIKHNSKNLNKFQYLQSLEELKDLDDLKAFNNIKISSSKEDNAIELDNYLFYLQNYKYPQNILIKISISILAKEKLIQILNSKKYVLN